MGAAAGFPRARAALGLYVLAAVLFTWPLAVRLTDHVPAGGNDLWQNCWNFWWWGKALGEGRSPYRTDLIYQPGDVSLAFHTHSEANVLTMLPVTLALGVPAALNAALLLGFGLAGWGGYLLARELTGDPRAAFLAGLVLAFPPHRLEQSLEHLNLASYQAMPFFLLFLVRLARSGGARNVLLAAVAFAANALYAWHNGLLVLPTAAVLFAHEVLRRRDGRLRALRDAAAAGALAALLLLPFLWPLVREIAAGDTSYLKPPVRKGIDLAFLLVPSEMHPLWGPLVQGLYERCRGYASAGYTCYLGVGALALWILGSLARGKPLDGTAPLAPRFSPVLWGALLGLHVLLALGDTLVVLGEDTGAPLPFALVRHMPVLQTVRLPNRFVVPAVLALSMLAAHGASRLLRGRGPLALAGAAALIAFDVLPVPYPMQPVPRPAWIEALAPAPPGLVLDLPGGHRARGAEDMHLQTLHGRPIAGGYASCVPAWMERRVKDLSLLELAFEGQPAVQVDVERGLAQVLEALPVQVLVLHLDRERERLERLAAQHRGTPLSRLFNPERGTAARTIAELRSAARKLWGPPVFADEAVEVHVRQRR
ncbi:MAG: hypothetical protein HY721_27980 [Planctomycetes bacterium]|nr:hypothetical protein [Planctomycetota bacterium]